MYAVIQSGGRQVRVEPGAVITVDHIALPAGEQVTSKQVLFVAGDDGSFIAGAPFVAGAKVTGVVDGDERGPKLRVFRKKRRKGRRRTLGHRTALTRVRITGIETDTSHGT